MPIKFQLPADPMVRFREIYDALNTQRGFWGDSTPLRFAALTALSCPGSAVQVATDIIWTAREIKERSGWFGTLNSPLRFIVSAMLLLNKDKPENFLREVDRVSTLFREIKLRRGPIYEVLAILLLRLNTDLQPIPDEAVHRFKSIYEHMKKYHWWLTGPDDFPACAILVNQAAPPEEIGFTIERIYQDLAGRKFSKGDPLQTAANILYLTGLNAAEVATRYAHLADRFRAAGVRIWQSDYDELAILTFLDHPAERIVDNVLNYRAAMKELKPKLDASMTFNLAASLSFIELVQQNRDTSRITDVKALLDMQNIINTQQAAAAAAAASAAAASAAN
ncbi:DUF4003 family protein [candidate division CSSED10-310 bacterium]|uniref:DUF4003 family protein n=1 Tax=candidate division CSSED10-310 bacterium TaxID=2855610 RepID=A0ABV6Z0E8_UNCC1